MCHCLAHSNYSQIELLFIFIFSVVKGAAYGHPTYFRVAESDEIMYVGVLIENVRHSVLVIVTGFGALISRNSLIAAVIVYSLENGCPTVSDDDSH